jgi:hypothetical protein
MPGMSSSLSKVSGGGSLVSGTFFVLLTTQLTNSSLILGPHGSSILSYPWGAISPMLSINNFDHGCQWQMGTLWAQKYKLFLHEKKMSTQLSEMGIRTHFH